LLNIRKATHMDIPRIVELYEELTEQKQNTDIETLNRVFDEIISLPNQSYLVAENDNYIVGTAFVQITPNLTHDAHPWAIIENVVVDSRYHRKGIGRLLMEQAIRYAREAGCYKVSLLSHKKRLEAHDFYRSMGFEESALGFRKYI
jgi:GNAT superfamily N-acetyltransferase